MPEENIPSIFAASVKRNIPSRKGIPAIRRTRHASSWKLFAMAIQNNIKPHILTINPRIE